MTDGLEAESNVLQMTKPGDAKILAEDVSTKDAGADLDTDAIAVAAAIASGGRPVATPTATGASTSAHSAAQPASSPLQQGAQPKQMTTNVTSIRKNLFRRKPHIASPVAGTDKLLEDAEYLLKHAAQAGIALDQAMVRSIITAGAADELSPDNTVGAFVAVTTLAEKLKPVTAETLRACEHDAGRMIGRYRKYVMYLGIPLIALSILFFITDGISKSVTEDIARANELAVTLTPIMQAPEKDDEILTKDSKNVANLQQYAATIRDVYGLSHWLGYFVLTFDSNPIPRAQMEIKPPIHIIDEVRSKLLVYQGARAFAKAIQVETSLLYGAVSNFLLPPLYAILGACAYLLRLISEQVKARTFTPSVTDTARFVIAAISGGVVGLFGNFANFMTGQGTSLSPLAIAFLLGYGSDIFFSFLDALQQAFTKAKSS